MKTIDLVFDNPACSIELTEKQAIELGIDLTKDINHGEMKTRGPWQIPTSFKALACSAIYLKKKDDFFIKCYQKTFYGMRTINNPKQGGYELEGRVSINGKKYSCFTSSQLFDVNGKTYDIAVIHARNVKQ